LLKRALAIYENSAGLHHVDVVSSLNNLGAVYFSMKEYPTSRTFFERALFIQQRFLGSNHPSTKTTTNWLNKKEFHQQ